MNIFVFSETALAWEERGDFMLPGGSEIWFPTSPPLIPKVSWALLMVSTSIMMDVTSLLLGNGGSPNSSVGLLRYYPEGRQVEADIQVPYWHHGGGELLTGWWDENHGSLLCLLWYHPGRGMGVTALIWVHLWELPLPEVDNLTLGLCPFSSLCGGYIGLAICFNRIHISAEPS